MIRPRAAATVVALLALAAGCSDGDGPQPAGEPAAQATVTAPPTTVPRTPAWQTRTAAPTARQEVASAVADGKVWVLGGITAAGASATVESYDPATDRWAPGPDLPVAVHHPAATAFRGEIVLAGGFLASPGDLYSRPSDRVFALRRGAWVELPRLARPRGAAAAAEAGDRLVVVGGRDTSRLIAPTEVFDGTAWRDARPTPSPRDHLAAASDGRSMYAVGGRRLDADATSAVLDRYDPAADAWETLPAMPTARGGLGAAVAGNRLVAVGGESASRTYAEVESYDPVARTWTSLPPSPSPRHGLAVGGVGATVVSLLGGTQAGVAPSARAEALSPL